MTKVRISPKFQIVIPKEIREPLGLKPGDQLLVVNGEGGISLIPMKPMSEYRGIVRGIDTAVEREPWRV